MHCAPFPQGGDFGRGEGQASCHSRHCVRGSRVGGRGMHAGIACFKPRPALVPRSYSVSSRCGTWLLFVAFVVFNVHASSHSPRGSPSLPIPHPPRPHPLHTPTAIASPRGSHIPFPPCSLLRACVHASTTYQIAYRRALLALTARAPRSAGMPSSADEPPAVSPSHHRPYPYSTSPDAAAIYARLPRSGGCAWVCLIITYNRWQTLCR